MQRGRAAARAGQRARARRYFAAVLEIDARQADAWLARAAVVDDPQEKLAHLARVLELDPGNRQAREAIRSARREVGNQPPAQAVLIPAVTSSGLRVARIAGSSAGSGTYDSKAKLASVTPIRIGTIHSNRRSACLSIGVSG